MKYSTKQKTMIILFWFFLVALAFITLKTQLDTAVESVNNQAEIGFFHLFNVNRTLLYLIIGIIITFPNIIPIIYYHYYQNNFISNILIRVPYKQYNRNSSSKLLIISFLFYLTLNLAIILLMQIFYLPFDFTKPNTIYLIFSQKPYMNLTYYVVLSSIGYALYNLFLFKIIIFIKNEYIYRMSSIIIFIISILLFLGIGTLIHAQSILVKVIISFMVPLNLFTPGLFFEEFGLISFVVSFVFYIILIVLLDNIISKRAVKYE